MKTRQFAKAELTRQSLTQAAIDTIVEVGYSATTASEISRRAGMTRGAFQHHFRSKNDIMLAVLNEMSKAVNIALDSAPTPDGPLSGRVDHLLGHYYNAYGTKLHFAAVQIWLNALRDPDLRKEVQYGLKLVDRSILKAWRNTFPELKERDQKLIALRRVIISAIRGSTIHQMWSKDKKSEQEDFDILRKFLLLYINDQLNCK